MRTVTSTSWLSLGPQIEQDGERLVAVTGWKWWVLTLGLSSRRVIVDPERAVVVIESRRLGLFTARRRIAFRLIEAVTYGYQDWSLGGGISMAHDSVDLFSVGLRLYDEREVHLFGFFGEGTFRNDGIWPDWIHGMHAWCDVSGTQERESHAYAEAVSRMIGRSIVPSRY
jgi:hypothetical protein